MLPRVAISRRPSTPQGQEDAAGSVPRQPRLARAIATVRCHWLVAALLAAGLALRVLTQVGYSPALIYIDTLKYLYGASPGSEPLGYTVVLRLILPLGGFAAVAVIQHLLGLAMAIALYLLLLRRGASRWLAALAVAPVLLDAYQLQMEQMIMPDVWFEAMIVAGLAVLLWRPNVTVRVAVAAGLLLGSSAIVKQLGELLVVPAAVYLLLAVGGGWRRAAVTSGALCLAFALPVLGYCSFSYATTGHFWLAHHQSSTGRLVAAADCATLTLPAAVRPLCPTPSEQQALGPDALEHSGQSPLFTAPAAAHTRGQLISELKAAVVQQQPLRVVVSILSDSLRLFAVTREPSPWVTPLSRWQFQTSYPTYPPWISICPASARLSANDCMVEQKTKAATAGGLVLQPGGIIIAGVQKMAFTPFHAMTVSPSYGGSASVNRPVAAFLRSYQLDGGYTPGPLFALFALAGLAGSALALTRRGGQLALACLLLEATAAVVLFVPDIFEYSWRYELPAVITLPSAGVLGLGALLSHRQARKRSRAERAEAGEPTEG